MSQWLKVVAVAVSLAVAFVLVAALVSDLTALGYNVVAAWRGGGFTKAVTVFQSGVAIDVVQSLVTIAAIAIGGLFAYYNRGLFRRTEPHLTITQDVSHRRINDQHVQIAVIATLRNGSNVKVEVRSSLCTLSQVAPLEPALVAALYDAGFGNVRESRTYRLGWPVLAVIPRDRSGDRLIIEPGASHQLVYEFIIASGVQSVAAVTVVSNERYDAARPERADGWTAYTVYDIMD